MVFVLNFNDRSKSVEDSFRYLSLNSEKEPFMLELHFLSEVLEMQVLGLLIYQFVETSLVLACN